MLLSKISFCNKQSFNTTFLIVTFKKRSNRMHQFKIYLLAITLCVFLSSCNPCNNLDCAASNFQQYFRIISEADGKDLVFGPAKIYDKNDLKFYSLKGTDTTFFEYQHTKSFYGGSKYDSTLSVSFLPIPDIAYMRLNNGDVDTLNISYKIYGTQCCGTITEITNIKFNNSVDLAGSEGTQEIKK